MSDGILKGLAHTLEAVTSQCGEFKREWNKSQTATDIPRLWEGEWHSEVNGHNGNLRCVLNKETNMTTVDAFFRAKYSRFLRACYHVTLSLQKKEESIALRGSTDLGALAGGLYEYEGKIQCQEFTCRYQCKYDRGEFRLKPSAKRQTDRP